MLIVSVGSMKFTLEMMPLGRTICSACAGHGHQADRADAEDHDVVAVVQRGILDRVEAGGHHVGRHQGVLDGNVVRHQEQVVSLF